MKFNELSTMSNLELAWRRITTGGNYQYKRFFRDLYLAYEVALKDNLKNLQERIRGDALTASAPERIYVPKSSGLHRPLSLLLIEDQIILQAFANLAAKNYRSGGRHFNFELSSVTFFRSPTAYSSFDDGRKRMPPFRGLSENTMTPA